MAVNRIPFAVLLVLAISARASAQPLPPPPGSSEQEEWPIPTPSEQIPLPNWQPAPVRETVAPPAAFDGRFRESTWYTRMDYFHWNERIDGGTLLNESGALWTLGYQRRDGIERYRGEFFAGDVGYLARIDYGGGFSEPLHSRTKYMGLKAEYDLLFESARLPTLNWYAGVGSRFWIRDLPDDFTPSGVFIVGYQESWWTLYPYLGAERRRIVYDGTELYWSGRAGLTAITLSHGTYDDTRLYPRPSAVAAFEMGMRGPWMFMGVSLETLNWGQSPEVRGWVQPASSLVLAGAKMGCSF